MGRNYRGINTNLIKDVDTRLQFEVIDDYLRDVNATIGALSKGNLPSSSNYVVSPAPVQSGGGQGTPVTTHHDLLGLQADDHPQYLNLNATAYPKRATTQTLFSVTAGINTFGITGAAGQTAALAVFNTGSHDRSSVDASGWWVGAADTSGKSDANLSRGLKISDSATYWYQDVGGVAQGAKYVKVLADLITTPRTLHWPDQDGNLLTSTDTSFFLDSRGKAGGQKITNTFSGALALGIFGHASQSTDLFQVGNSAFTVWWSIDKNGVFAGQSGAVADFRGCAVNAGNAAGANLLIGDGTFATSVEQDPLFVLTANRTLSLQNDSGFIPLRNYYSLTTYESKTAAIAQFTAYTTTHAGLYRVSAYLVDKATTTAGTVTARVAYTDRSGAQGPTAIATVVMTGVGIVTLASPMTIYCTSGSAIKFDTTVGTFVGTYDCYLSIEAI